MTGVKFCVLFTLQCPYVLECQGRKRNKGLFFNAIIKSQIMVHAQGSWSQTNLTSFWIETSVAAADVDLWYSLNRHVVTSSGKAKAAVAADDVTEP